MNGRSWSILSVLGLIATILPFYFGTANFKSLVGMFSQSHEVNPPVVAPPPVAPDASQSPMQPSQSLEKRPTLQPMLPVDWSSQDLMVSARDPAGATTYPLLDGVQYDFEVSGTYDPWGGTPNRVDALACFGKPPGGGRPARLAQGFRIDDQGLIDLSGGVLAYDPEHRYKIRVVGRGQPVQLYINDARGSASDNVGELKVRISRVPS